MSKERIEELLEELRKREKEMVPFRNELHKLMDEESEAAKHRIIAAKAGHGNFKEDELKWAAYNRCECGAGLAHPAGIGINGSWYCSAILMGNANREVLYVNELPFAFYEIKSDTQPQLVELQQDLVNNMENQIKQFRVKVDGVNQLLQTMKPVPTKVEAQTVFVASDELLKTSEKLLFAKAWAGKLLAAIGTPTPYKNEGVRKTVADIEPTADVAKKVEDFPLVPDDAVDVASFNHIEKIDFLRGEIKAFVEYVEKIDTKDKSREFAIARTNVYNYLCEASMWLGFELQRIKEGR